MTRFARAKGSKASNERLPNEGTPWHVMKQQLEENQAKNNNAPQKVKSAKELLKERENVFSTDATANNNHWAEFEVPESQRLQKKKKKAEDNVKKGKEVRKEAVESRKRSKSSKGNVEISETEIGTKKKKVKKEMDSEDNSVHRTDSFEEGQNTDRTEQQCPNKKGQRKECAKEDGSDHQGPLTKRQKRNLKKKDENSEKNENSKNSNKHCADKNNSRIKTFNAGFDGTGNKFNGEYNNFNRSSSKRIIRTDHLKAAKVRDNKEHARRKPEPGPTKMVINGVEVEIVKYDGFPVKREDAERLKDLRKQMVMKGIPKKDIDAAMKLERRRAEKALARIRREVCYHCRKAGHILSDCPELGAEQAGTGICFKCGSTEHTHFECKVSRPTEYRFAKCFICREQGHIAKQCPDNPKGVYPQGGACKVCGDVTHLKKDCPDLIKEKEETSITVDTIVDDALESLDKNKCTSSSSGGNNMKKKVVKF